MTDTFYFYVNFPRFSEKSIFLHKSNCGHSKDGKGKRGTSSNEKGFWAGPFKKYDHARAALLKLNSKFQNPPRIEDCDCIQKGDFLFCSRYSEIQSAESNYYIIMGD